MRFRSVFAAAAVLFTGLFSAAEATPVTYTLKGVAVELVNGVDYVDPFTWTLVGDSTSLMHPVSGGWILPFTSNTLVIDNVGTIIPSLPMQASNVFGPISLVISDTTVAGGIAVYSFALPGYDGITTMGPINVSYAGAQPLPSNLGDFAIVYAVGLTLTVDGVPEPFTLALFGAGLAGLGFARRRRAQA